MKVVFKACDSESMWKRREESPRRLSRGRTTKKNEVFVIEEKQQSEASWKPGRSVLRTDWFTVLL